MPSKRNMEYSDKLKIPATFLQLWNAGKEAEKDIEDKDKGQLRI